MMARHFLPRVILSGVWLVVGCLDAGDVDLVDGALDESAETSVAISETNHLPDLIVTAVGDPPTSAAIGEIFTASETVMNQGGADAPSSYTKYYLSGNGVTPQYLLGNRSVGAIAVGASDSGTASARVPAGVPQGAYRILACADSGPGTGGRLSQIAENSENNNCTASAGSVSITGPDLIVSSVSVSPSTLDTTGTLTVSDTVDNIGTASAGASVTRWWFSADNVKSPDDAFVRNCINGDPIPGRSVGSISAGGSSSGSASTSPLCVRDATGLHPPATGTYYVIACADTTSQVGELNEYNNCAASSTTVQITSSVDLVHTAVSNPPTTGAVGASFAITDTVQNIGGDPASSTYTKFYLSTDGTFLNAYLNTRSVGALGSGASDSATTTMTILAGTPSGTYYVVACADSGPGTGGRMSEVPESNENNNCRASSGTITIGSPDLVISALTDPPVLASRGSSFPVTTTTANIGAGDAGTFYNKYYLSANGTSPLYMVVPGTTLVGPLAAGTSQVASVTATIPTSVVLGTYWLIGCADAGPGTAGRTSQVTESNERNNCTRSATQVIVQQ